jgi:molecular chaperone GrpE
VTPRIHKLVERFYRTMSSKHHSKSTAIAQEEMAQDLSDDSIESGGKTPEMSPVDAESEAELSAHSADNSAADQEFKIIDKRRSLGENDDSSTSSEGGRETISTDELDTFEIDLDQMKLDAQAVEREMEELRTKLKESEARRNEAIKASEDYADRFRRAQLQLRAETEEMRARLQRTFEQKLELARGDVVASLLDTLDNLRRAVIAAEVATDQSAAFDALRDGVRATAEMFENQLQKMGLRAVASEGEQFNPEVHDAVELAVVPKEQDNVILAELQRGYKFGDRLLRPARVKVGRAE